jgi:pimeloyl-ACP methyl ester carboxylesterase
MYGIQLPRPAVDLKVKRRFSPQVTVAATTNADMREGSGVSEVSCVKSNVHPASTTKPTAPTLLIVGGMDRQVLRLNRAAQARMRCETRLEIVPGATHLFEEPGGLDRVAELAAVWFTDHVG